MITSPVVVHLRVMLRQAHGITTTAQECVRVWHRRHGHMKPRTMQILRKIDNTGVDYAGSITGCGIVGRSTEHAHLKTAKHNIVPTYAVGLLEYIDLAVPIFPPALGGYQYVAKYTDHSGRWHEIFPIKKSLTLRKR